MTRKLIVLIGLCFTVSLMALSSLLVYWQLIGHYAIHGRLKWVPLMLIVTGLLWVAADWFDL
jgi:hypothetical protein